MSVTKIPAWVSQGSVRKYHRAVAQLTKENADRIRLNQPIVAITDEAVKALYVKWAGLLVETEPAEKVEGDVEAPAEKPKKAK